MKNLFLVMLLLLTARVYSQEIKESDIPSVVKNEFHTAFPTITKATWSKEDGSYEAEFEENHIEKSTLIDPNGNLLQIETEIEPSELPTAVKDAVKKDYPHKKIHEASKIVAGSNVKYEAEIRDKGKSYDLIYSEDGNFIEKKLNSEEEK